MNLRSPAELALQYGLSQCSVCGEKVLLARASDLTEEEIAQLTRAGIQLLLGYYGSRAVCLREREAYGICLEG
ncbi:MAG: hypothetical protein AB1331_01290 [Bacillota bacterium]